MSSDDSDDEIPMYTTKRMNDRTIALFKANIQWEDYSKAIKLVKSCIGYVPTPFVINDIIFKIIMSCNEKLAYKAGDYLESRLRVMSTHNDQTHDFIIALKDQSGTAILDIWDTFSHCVWSSLYHLKVPEASHSYKTFLKSPNCDILIEIYIKAFLKCSIKRDILGSRAEERFSCLLKWISLYYKYNCGGEAVLSYLHSLLDYIVESEILIDSSLPKSVKIHSANLSQYMFIILNVCKEVFADPEKQQRFFIFTGSEYLSIKVCQFRLHEMIDEKSLHPNPGMLTLKSIVEDYFFHHPDEKKRSSMAMNENGIKAMKKFSQDPIVGDTNFHERCRLGRPADLLSALYAEKSKDINKRNSVGNTPLHEACLASSYLCCKFLIEEAGDRKVDYRAIENGGRTPLHCAVYVDAFDIVKLLLNRGGNDLVICEDNWGKKPIDYSTSNEMRKMLEEIELRLEKSQGTSGSAQLKLPNLKNSKDYYLYLRTLRTLACNYCEIYDLSTAETNAKTLSHDSKECYHFKAGRKTLCSEDYSTLSTFYGVTEKFLSLAELVSNEENVKKELSRWKKFPIVPK